MTVDGGGASSGSLLYTAVQYLEEGKCDYAVVGATNLIFKPGVQLGMIGLKIWVGLILIL